MAARLQKRILTNEQVIEIFLLQLDTSALPLPLPGSPSARLAQKYHVSPKTIRDIWSGRTWTNVTAPIIGIGEIPCHHAYKTNMLERSVKMKIFHFIQCMKSIIDFVGIIVQASQGRPT